MPTQVLFKVMDNKILKKEEIMIGFLLRPIENYSFITFPLHLVLIKDITEIIQYFGKNGKMLSS
jgi:hypothetical protein